jgi:starch phosphorylase
VKKLTGLEDDAFNHSLVALRFAHLANAVSQLHGNVSRAMWSKYKGYLSHHRHHQCAELALLGR